MSQPALTKHMIAGFGVQSQQGVAETVPVWAPFTGDWGLQPMGGMQAYDESDLVGGTHLALPTDDWWEGDLPFTFRPNAAFLAELALWAMAPDSTYNQYAWATVWLREQVGGVKTYHRWLDCKVRRLSFRYAKGSPLTMGLSAVSIGGHSTAYTPTEPSGTFGAPFNFDHCRVRRAAEGGGLATDVHIEEWSLDIDTAMQDPRDGYRANEDSKPLRLYNTREPAPSGTFTRDRVDTTIDAAWAAMMDGLAANEAWSLEFGLFDGAVYCIFAVPRAVPPPRGVSTRRPGGTADRATDSINFFGLMGNDGADAVTMTVGSGVAWP